MKITSAPIVCALATTLVFSGTSAYAWHEQHHPALFEMYVFALKSGRSILIRTPDDRRILIDGGSNSEVIRHITKVIPFYSRRIDALFITNTQAKNVNGLIDLVTRYSIQEVYIPKFTSQSIGLASSTDGAYDTFISAIEERHIQPKHVSMGDTVEFGSVSLHILFPSPPEQFEYSKASAPEILLNILFGKRSVLFMGDASPKIQRFIAYSSGAFLVPADVLIVSHSASSGLLTDGFMETFKPHSLIYSKQVPKESQKKSASRSPKKSTSKKSDTLDPLATILIEDRYNLKAKGMAHIVSDGTMLEIKNPD